MRSLGFVVVLAACGHVELGSVERTVTVAKIGDGDGEVTSDSKLDCGATCDELLGRGEVVTLTAVPAPGAAFDGWSGACSGTDTTCTVTVDDNVTVNAEFGRPRLALTFGGTGAGTVTSDPAGISCESDCDAQFDLGTAVTLTATNDSGSFTGWSGVDNCPGIAPCTTTVDKAMTVTANFLCGGTQKLAFTGSAQTFAIPACASGFTVEAYGAQGGTGAAGRNTNPAGGLGAEVVGTFATTGTLTVIVGGMGATSSLGNAGGGGGTFIYSNATDAMPLVAAAGGGGLCTNSVCAPAPGSATVTPTASVAGSGNTAGGAGGMGGTGGTATASFVGGGGGAGWLSDGLVGAMTGGGGGQSPGDGAAGGIAATSGANGGFGGGGASAGDSGACGGGGGFNGGGGGNGWDGTNWGCGGGGGSFNGGTSPTARAGVQSGNGKVTITWF